MPSSHRRYAEWTPDRFRRWARTIGPNTEALITAILTHRFPIKDHVSAWLMRLKAEALYEAGIIDTEEMSTVLERAAAVLDKASKRAA